MKILQINGYESPGSRFHGLSITPILQKKGVYSKHLVWRKDTKKPEILTFDFKTKLQNTFIRIIEEFISVQSMLYTSAKQIVELQEFQEADLIHLHIIHSGYFSMGDIHMISDLKPTIWTLHDPWAMTGHCIHPKSCERWKIGCGSCPDLRTSKPLLFDTTKFLFEYKKKSYKKANFDIVVASKWMQNMVEQSPIFDDSVPVHRIPFGLDLDFFHNRDTADMRDNLGIPNDALTICFRSDYNEFKGLKYILEALEKIHSEQQIYIITLSGKPLSGKLGNKFKVIDVGWTNDPVTLRDAMIAADIFLMPSIAEAFGVMAIEAMACSKPIIVFDGTSLEEVTFAPDVGVSVPMKNSDELARALQHLIDNPEERERRGAQGRKMAERHYDENLHVDRMVELYQKVLAR